MSGRGRKKSNHGAAGRRSNPPSRKGAGPAKPRSSTPPSQAQDKNPPARPPAGRSPRATQPAAGGESRRPPRPPAQRPPAQRARPGRPPRDVRRKRNQRIGVLIGALALAGALVGSVLLGQRDASTAQAQNTGATTASTPSSTATAPVTSSAPASTTVVTPMAITCPTGGGATTDFGHDILVPAPYKVTITYGDGDKYTNDSAHLGAIFSHTYKKAGKYAVNAVLTTPDGQTASADCTYTWGP